MNRLCDKCSYQNDCFDENQCPFNVMEDSHKTEGETADSNAIKNFEYLKTLEFNDMAAFLATGLGGNADDIEAWLAMDHK